jgi:hypothetical protein
MTTYIFQSTSGERFYVQGDMAAVEFMHITRMTLIGTMPERYSGMSYRLVQKDYSTRGCYVLGFSNEIDKAKEYINNCWLFNLTSEEVGQILGGN